MEGNVSGYVCNHGSPNGERDTASPRLWAMLRTQASDEEADDVFSRRHLYCGTPVVTSWAVAGQQVVFLHMYLQTRVTLRAFPVATPRGRSVSFPIRGTMVTYVTWDVSEQDFKACFANHLIQSRTSKHVSQIIGFRAGLQSTFRKSFVSKRDFKARFANHLIQSETSKHV